MAQQEKQFFDISRLQTELIRSLIYQPRMIPSVSKIVSEEDFINKKYSTVYHIILDNFTNGDDTTESDIAMKLQEKGISFTIEDERFLFNEDTPVQPPTNLAKLLKRESIKLQAGNVYKLFGEELISNNLDLEENLGNARKQLEDLSIDLAPEDDVTFVDQVDQFFAEIQSEEAKGIPSLYPSLDRYTKGWLPGQLITVAARTSVGKSIMAVNCALAAALEGKRVLFFSLEMGASELISRLIASKAFIPMNRIYPRLTLEGEELQKFMQAKEEVRNLPIVIKDDPMQTVESIRAEALKQEQTDKVDFIIVDYIQLISTGRRGSRQEEVASISRELKILAKQLDVPVMIVAQLLRGSKDDEDRLPSMEDIRESGAIANDSDVAVIIHRKYRDKSENPKALFLLDKNRNGPAGKKITVSSMLHMALFKDEDLDEDKEITEDSVDTEIQDKTQITYPDPEPEEDEMFDGLDLDWDMEV